MRTDLVPLLGLGCERVQVLPKRASTNGAASRLAERRRVYAGARPQHVRKRRPLPLARESRASCPVRMSAAGASFEGGEPLSMGEPRVEHRRKLTIV